MSGFISGLIGDEKENELAVANKGVDDWIEIEEDALDSDEEAVLVALICLLIAPLAFNPSGLIMNPVKYERVMLR